MNEEWRIIPSFPNYEASSHGNIRRNGKILSKVKSNGYLQLKVCKNSNVFTRHIHVLVCEAFHGKKPELSAIVAHNDGNKENNIPSNLRWTTYKDNSNDMIIHGTKLELENHPRSTLTNEQVLEIIQIYKENMGKKYVKRGTRQFLAEKYNVTISAIKDIIQGRSWSDITLINKGK
jgi:hypothetical protein